MQSRLSTKYFSLNLKRILQAPSQHDFFYWTETVRCVEVLCSSVHSVSWAQDCCVSETIPHLIENLNILNAIVSFTRPQFLVSESWLEHQQTVHPALSCEHLELCPNKLTWQQFTKINRSLMQHDFPENNGLACVTSVQGRSDRIASMNPITKNPQSIILPCLGTSW
jgi:hypothetical protein